MRKSIELSKVEIKSIMATFEEASLAEEKACYLHFTFKTKIGKFVDDVEFYFDEGSSLIHYKSASQKGWYDFNANKRRMKKVVAAWKEIY